ASGLQSGNQVTVSWVTTNSGSSTISDSFFDGLVVTNKTTGKPLYQKTVFYDAGGADGPLAAGKGYQRQVTFTLPDGSASVGDVQFAVTADAFNQIPRLNPDGSPQTNNTTSVTQPVTLAAYPDLQVQGLAVNPSGGLQSGTTITITWNDANTGTR